jgi:cysteine-rich repeat protein
MSRTRYCVTSALLAVVMAAGTGCGNDGKDGNDADDVTGDEDGTDTTLDGVDVPPDSLPPDIDPETLPPCYCGNARSEPECDEECDDGNYENGDDCLSNCRLATCGDGFWRSLPAVPSDAEECDDGNDVADDGCEADCTFSCHSDEDCDDGEACTDDLCDTMYFHTCYTISSGEGSVCGTGDLCTGLGTCISGTCVYSDPLVCDDDQPCTTDTCDPAEGCVFTPLPAGTPCDDGLFCWTGDTCSSMGFCYSHPAHPCDDGDPCTIDECNEDSDSCSHSTPIYRSATCGSYDRGTTYMMPSTYTNYTCPDGTHVAGGADYVYEVAASGAGTLAVTIDTSYSHPSVEAYVLSDACDLTSCLGHGRSVSLSVTAGTYYIVIESDTGGGSYQFSTTCP